MAVQYDRRIAISTAGSRKSIQWQPQTLYWSELIERLKIAARGTETLQEYLKLPKPKQDDLKDVGGFVGGTLAGNRRKASAVTGRDLLTLDLDNIPAGATDDVLRRLEGLGCAYVVYSTRKHEPGKPRLRCIFPFDRTATADEYEPLARKLADIIGMSMMDPTTFEASRLMYWPSCCADSQYVYQFADKPFLSVEGLLGTYQDWRDIDSWPVVPGSENKHIRLAAKQGNPLEKPGIVGAFCRQYNIRQAIDKFLPGVYEQVDSQEDRYTFIEGSTFGGAILYENGLFLYSHHATDPCSGKLVNSFDLVRLHKFGDEDDEALPGTPINRLPSYKNMNQLALNDKKVSGALAIEQYERVQQDFGLDPGAENAPQPVNEDVSFMTKLNRNQNGNLEKSIENVQIILEGDPRIRGRIRWDAFTEEIKAVAPLPWEPRIKTVGEFSWSEKYDDYGLMAYIEKLLKCRDKNIINAALMQCAVRHQFHPIHDYLDGLTWDGQSRLDTLFIDYLGAVDSEYVRQVTRKSFVAAIARTKTPGIKYDYMTVLSGGQGKGKTTMLKKIGLNWYNDSIQTFEGKDAIEALQSAWIVNIDELSAFSRTDIKLMRGFLSRTEDVYRAAYARKSEKHPRQCVFFGTSNDDAYLQDEKGNRRFFPIDIGLNRPTKRIFDDQKGLMGCPLLDDEVDQLWAEAMTRWRSGEKLELEGKAAEEARVQQDLHKEQSPWEAQVLDFIERPVPVEWNKKSIDERNLFWSVEFGKSMSADIKTESRDRVCAQEIWVECLGNRLTFMRKSDARQINDILANMPGWTRVGNPYRYGPYGKIRGGYRKL